MLEIPYGTGTMRFNLPDAASVENVTTPQFPAPQQNIEQVLMNFAQQVLHESRPDVPIVVVYTDVTRASPDQVLAEPLVRVFQNAGREVEFLCAVGMHRPSTLAEKHEKLGSYIVENFDVIDHDPTGVKTIGHVQDVPIEVNPMLLAATVISLGVVEPHQYAGYSGGYKTTVIGCGGAHTIAATHGPQFLNMTGTRLANMDNNPFQDFVRSAGKELGHDYAVNVIMDTQHRIIELAAGKPEHVHDTLIAKGRNWFEVRVKNASYDVVIAGLGAPKDANLYQASRAATYIGLSGQPAVKQGGAIIVPAEMSEGAGTGKGEQNMFNILAKLRPSQALLDHLLKNGCLPGEQRAFMIAKLMQTYRLIFVGAKYPEIIEQVHIPHFATIEAAIESLNLDQPKILVVPHAIHQIPVPTSPIEKPPQ